MTLASVALACDGSTVDGGNGAMDASSDASQASGGSGGEGAGGAAGTSPLSCNMDPCEGFEYAGMVQSTCCVDTTICGVDLNGTCVPPEALEEREAGTGFGVGEAVVDDPSCPSFTFGGDAGLALTGCCDGGGVCGVSTEPLAASGTFPIPPMCITPEEAQSFGQSVADAGEQPCDYPTDAGAGSPDGG
jgi:hypothetical protein